MAITLVDYQDEYAEGLKAGDPATIMAMDCTHLAVDDFVVIAGFTGGFGPAHRFYNEFDGAVGTYNTKTSGFFGDSTDVFGTQDATMVQSTLGAVFIIRHKVTALNLTDTSGGTGTLLSLGFKLTSVNAYGGAIAMWTFRGGTYASKVSDTDFSTGPITAHALTQSVLTEHDAFFSIGVNRGNGYSFPTTYTHTITDDLAFTPVTDQEDFTYIAGSTNNGFAVCINSAQGPNDDASTQNFAVSDGGDSGAVVGVANAVVTFTESFVDPQPDDGFPNYERLHAKAKALPYYLDTGLLRGLDV